MKSEGPLSSTGAYENTLFSHYPNGIVGIVITFERIERLVYEFR